MTQEKEAQLRRAHSRGLQKLLSFETADNGFGWYAGRRANTVLTAYAAMFLADLSKVYEFDRAVLDRTIGWLDRHQDSRGRWAGTEQHRTWRRLSDSAIPSTAYVAWALRIAGREHTRSYLRALEFLRKADTADPYAWALIANAVPTKENLDMLAKLSREGRWTTQLESWNTARGTTADVETTALAVIALADHEPQLADEAAAWLIRQKGRYGAWNSTQATVLALKALQAVGGGKRDSVAARLWVNGREIPKAFITSEDPQSFDISPYLKTGKNEVTLESTNRVNVQVTGSYYLPWGTQDMIREVEGLNLQVTYDKTEVKVGETVTCTVKVEADSFMVMAEVAIPPGFTADRADLDALAKKGTIDKFTLAGRKITFYLPGKDVTFSYTLRPRYPVKVTVPRSVVYEYYTPDRRVISPPQSMTVR